MPNFIIKTHKQNVVYTDYHIYILNKGLNSGKPQKEPFANSFVVIVQNQDDLETVYWLAYSLWKSKYWHISLCGSVIPFLRIGEFKKNFISKVTLLRMDFEQHKKHINALRLLEQQEQHFQKNLTLINELRRTILHNYTKQ
ncbi:MAG: hypothetical protein B7Y83_12275 [Flavobacteriales bacterium 32-34-25]|nr:MAG: hypothetical protein B7Y83_12275 [Flavobacteriales bacterium 32-34-25]